MHLHLERAVGEYCRLCTKDEKLHHWGTCRMGADVPSVTSSGAAEANLCLGKQWGQEQIMNIEMGVPGGACIGRPGGSMKPGGGATPGGGRSMGGGMPPGKGMGANCMGAPGTGCGS